LICWLQRYMQQHGDVELSALGMGELYLSFVSDSVVVRNVNILASPLFCYYPNHHPNVYTSRSIRWLSLSGNYLVSWECARSNLTHSLHVI
jgi:hypothetical protein